MASGTGIIEKVAEGCLNCTICVKECAFLQKHGVPGTICTDHRTGQISVKSPVFECNLCDLCSQLCPANLEISKAFIEIRKSIQSGTQRLPITDSVHKRHKSICDYERRNSSTLFSLQLLPDDCHTIFFPGCTLAATRPKVTGKTYEFLQDIEPNCGIVLNCCGKPSHDLGLTDKFSHSFTTLCNSLKTQNIKRVITACPSCYMTFRTYAPELSTQTVYELLAGKNNLPPLLQNSLETCTIHDACVTRWSPQIHDSVRSLVAKTGLSTEEATHCREKSICCGEGGAATLLAPEITNNWKKIRKVESAGKRVITYCAGCSSTLGQDLQTTHLLDLIFDQKQALQGTEQQTKAPFSSINKLLLKHQLLRASTRITPGHHKLPVKIQEKASLFYLQLLLISAVTTIPLLFKKLLMLIGN